MRVVCKYMMHDVAIKKELNAEIEILADLPVSTFLALVILHV